MTFVSRDRDASKSFRNGGKTLSVDEVVSIFEERPKNVWIVNDGVRFIRIGEMIYSLTMIGFVESIENIAHNNLPSLHEFVIGEFLVFVVFDQNEVMKLQCL